jgi:hypothetical protein
MSRKIINSGRPPVSWSSLDRSIRDINNNFQELYETGINIQGLQAVQGTQGIQGTSGAGTQGTQGTQGFQGISGEAAFQGIQGEQGTQGTQGIQGITGAGTQGTQGIQGIQGNTGDPGSRTYTVTNSGASAYVIDGANNPTLNLLRGFTYEFNVNASGHPFWIQTVPAPYSSGNVYNNGVTNNGAAVGKIIFAVPFNAPSTLYYVCQFHGSMTGTINITDVGPAGTQGIQGITGTAVLNSRSTVSGTAIDLNNGSSEDISITGFKGYLLYKIQTSAASWVRLYSDVASRTADSSRTQGVDPAPDAGVIAEIITTDAQTVLITPAAIGFNNESEVSDTIPVRITNLSGDTASITVTLTILQIEN